MLEKISILTICPEMFGGLFRDHVVERAQKLGRLTLEVVDIRSYAEGSFRKVDDSPYGGGAGMILRVGPVLDAIRDIRGDNAGDTGSPGEACTALLAPIGATYDQGQARELLAFRHLILVCGHYEGVDARVYDHVDRIISIGDYVLSGGEIAAMAVTDSLARLLPGVLKEGSLAEESFSDGLLEYPQYTRPADYRGERVPEVLLSGDHAAIRAWRREQARRETEKRRPDLISTH